jgi:hypothetical protein
MNDAKPSPFYDTWISICAESIPRAATKGTAKPEKCGQFRSLPAERSPRSLIVWAASGRQRTEKYGQKSSRCNDGAENQVGTQVHRAKFY